MRLGALAGIALTVACATTSAVPRVTAPDVLRAQGSDPAVDQASLERGRSLYLSRCTGCHQPFAPASREYATWESVVAEMSDRAGLAVDDARLIRVYLATFASR